MCRKVNLYLETCNVFCCLYITMSSCIEKRICCLYAIDVLKRKNKYLLTNLLLFSWELRILFEKTYMYIQGRAKNGVCFRGVDRVIPKRPFRLYLTSFLFDTIHTLTGTPNLCMTPHVHLLETCTYKKLPQFLLQRMLIKHIQLASLKKKKPRCTNIIILLMLGDLITCLGVQLASKVLKELITVPFYCK